MNHGLNDLISTKIDVSVLDSDNHLCYKKSFKNSLAKEGVSVMSRLLIDPSAPKPSHIYARFADDKSDADESTSFPTEFSEVVYEDFVVSADPSIGTLRQPIFSTVKVENNDDIIDGKITFFFRLTPDDALDESFTFTAGTSEVFYIGLAAARNLDDVTQDMIFSVLSTYDGGNDGFTIPIGGQVAIDYQLTLGV